MNKLKKIIVSIIIGLIAVLGMYNTSNAYSVGQHIDVTYNDYLYNGNIYCCEHHQALREHNSYRIISEVSIEGNKSTDYKGKSINSWYNAKLAYILSATDTNAIKNSVWNYMYTWLAKVGNKHAGLYTSFSNGVHGVYTWLDTASTNYANSIKETTEIKDNTDKSKIKVKVVDEDEKSYIRVGPFNWTFPGTMEKIEIQDQNKDKIKNVKFSQYKGEEQKIIDVSEIKSGKNFYVYIPMGTDVTKITKITGKSSTSIKSTKIWFLESLEGYKQNLIIREPYEAPLDVETPFDVDIPLLGNLKVIKVNKDNKQVKLEGVKFIFLHEATGKYLAEDENGKIKYVNKRENAKEWVTNKDGEILVNDIIVGKYLAYETENPNYGYETETGGKPITVVASETREKVIGNNQIYVKLSGYVWDEVASGKIGDAEIERNSLYDEESKDSKIQGVTVRLKDKAGNIIDTTTTGDGNNGTELGKYIFENVLIDEIKAGNYYIEFEYDGLIYQNVPEYNMSTWNAKEKDKYKTDYEAHEVANASKAAENANIRAEFNKKFTVIEGNGTPDGGVAKDGEGHEISLKYNIKEQKKSEGTTVAELDHSLDGTTNKNYLITSDTNTASYNIKDHFTDGQEEITNINLGLERREQADLSITKSIDNVNVTINGYGHTYKYSQVLANEGEDSVDGFNVGVRYGRAEGDNHYRAAIYKSDYGYTNEAHKENELKVYIVYKIKIQNNSSSLHAKVNEIVDYFDSRYELVGAEYELEENGNLVGTTLNDDGDLIMPKDKNIAGDSAPYSEDYQKVIIDTSGKTMGTTDDNAVNNVYVEFKLNRGAVADILEEKDNTTDEKELLDNVVEINSYSILDANGNVYGALDGNSAPGNAVPPTKEDFAKDDPDPITYENDTNLSPALKLEVAEARKMTGKVFLDETAEETQVGAVREGDGKYTANEKGIKGVTVTLTEQTENSNVEPKTATTNEYGDFEIEGYIPGNYKLTYTWGNETYTVQNYKGTVYDKDRYDKNMANKFWYIDESQDDPRYTDAVDDFEKRKEIDAELEEAKYNSTTTKHEMVSTTPQMGIGVENTKETITPGINKVEYLIKNIDFGIVERARQNLELSKRVSSLKLTLANEEVLTDVKIEEKDGRRVVTGQKDSLAYMEPGQNPVNGQVQVLLNSELIQGAKLEVTYSIVVTNKSELDYYSEKGAYYLYGEKEGNVITISPTKIIDYLDKDWAFDKTEIEGEGWQIETIEELNGLVSEKVYKVDEETPEEQKSTIEDKTILYTEKLANEKLAPLEGRNTAEIPLKVSKILSTADEVLLDNETEVIGISKTGGSKVQFTPGDYVPGSDPTETSDNDDAKAETTMVTPSFGENKNYIIPITIGIAALIILGIGVVIIKKKVMRD